MICGTCLNGICDLVDCVLMKFVDCCDWCVCILVNLVVDYYLIMIINMNCTSTCLYIICMNYYMLVILYIDHD